MTVRKLLHHSSGRNLPIKEFCYLRTVNQTAAIWLANYSSVNRASVGHMAVSNGPSIATFLDTTLGQWTELTVQSTATISRTISWPSLGHRSFVFFLLLLNDRWTTVIRSCLSFQEPTDRSRPYGRSLLIVGSKRTVDTVHWSMDSVLWPFVCWKLNPLTSQDVTAWRLLFGQRIDR